MPYQIDEQAPCKVGNVLAESKMVLGGTGSANVYRKFIGITNKDYFIVQDFYQASHKKTIIPNCIIQKDFLTNILQSFVTRPFDGVFVSWHENGSQIKADESI